MQRSAFVVLMAVVWALGCGGAIHDGADHTVTPTPNGFFDVDLGIPNVATAGLPGNSCADDVEATVAALVPDGSPLGFHSGTDEPGQIIPWPHYLGTAENNLGLNNHFQSIVRLPHAPFVLISGSNVNSGNAQAYLASVSSRPRSGRWGTNLVGGDLPEPTDQLVLGLTLMTERWHAGGMATLGTIVAIPIESDGSSDVQFWDFADPLDPEPLGVLIERADNQAAAIALDRLPDGRVLAIVREKELVDFYFSLTADLRDGFGDFVRWDSGDAGDGMNNAQNIHLVRDCSGPLYLLTSRNTSLVAPTFPGKDRVYLWEVALPDEQSTPTGHFEPVLDRELSCDGGFLCNLDAAGSAFVTDEGELLYYGARHFRDEAVPGITVTWMAEFAAP